VKKIGFTLSHNTLDAPLSDRFAEASWLLIYEGPQAFNFIRNQPPSGSQVVKRLRGVGCTDAVFSKITWKELEQLKAAEIQPWYGPVGVPVRKLLERLRQREKWKRRDLNEAGEGGHTL